MRRADRPRFPIRIQPAPVGEQREADQLLYALWVCNLFVHYYYYPYKLSHKSLILRTGIRGTSWGGLPFPCVLIHILLHMYTATDVLAEG
jgi:hypothetical protein